MHSQNNEEEIILDYFNGKIEVGTLLDIGANDGKTLSNTFALLEKGWRGVLIEPARRPYEKLFRIYGNRMDVYCLNIAIGTEDKKEVDFFSMDSHLGNGDTDLLSTVIKSETERWAGTKFTETKVLQTSFASFMEISRYKEFDFINIDAEGADLSILQQINLREIGCKLLCIEHNGIYSTQMKNHCSKFGLIEIFRNYENSIFTL